MCPQQFKKKSTLSHSTEPGLPENFYLFAKRASSICPQDETGSPVLTRAIVLPALERGHPAAFSLDQVEPKWQHTEKYLEDVLRRC